MQNETCTILNGKQKKTLLDLDNTTTTANNKWTTTKTTATTTVDKQDTPKAHVKTKQEFKQAPTHPININHRNNNNFNKNVYPDHHLSFQGDDHLIHRHNSRMIHHKIHMKDSRHNCIHCIFLSSIQLQTQHHHL